VRRGRSAPTTARIIAHLNDRLRDDDRRALFDQPLDEFLRGYRLGEVAGAAAQRAANGEVVSVEIEIALHQAAEAVVPVLREALEQLGAPRGSFLRLPISGREVAAGHAEGMAIYLQTRGLPAEVYAQGDINAVFQELDRLVAPQAKIHSYWEGDAETALYLYGRSFAVMRSRLAELLVAEPLCQGARIERIA
jgi:hypothetical protein